MAKSKQYPLGTFMKEFSKEAKCREYLANLRWPVSICRVPQANLRDSGNGAP